MIYDVRHVTTYTYGSPVTFAQCTLRMLPSSGVGQTVLSRSLTIDPHPSSLAEHVSFFGEQVAVAQIDTAHTELRIEARSCVRVERRRVAAEEAGLPWEQVREQAFAIQSLRPDSPAHFIFASRLTPFWPEVTAYVAQSFVPAGPIVAAGARPHPPHPPRVQI